MLFFSGCILSTSFAIAEEDAEKSATITKQADAAEPTGWKKHLKRFSSSSVSLGTTVGSATFVTGYADNPLVEQSFNLNIGYKLTDKIGLGMGWGFGFEYTQPDNDTGRRFSPSDISVSARYSLKEPWFEGNIPLSLRATLPTSQGSIYNNTITNLGLGTGYSKSFFKKLTVSYSFGFTKHLQASIFRDTKPATGSVLSDDGLPMVLPRVSSGEDGSVGSGGPMNTNFSLRNSISLSYQIMDKLSAGISFGISNFFRYAVPDGFFQNPDLPVVGRGDMTSGSIGVDYQLLDDLSLSFSINSSQPALTSDNKSIRFPFWAFNAPEGNYSSFSLSASYSFGGLLGGGKSKEATAEN